MNELARKLKPRYVLLVGLAIAGYLIFRRTRAAPAAEEGGFGAARGGDFADVAGPAGGSVGGVTSDDLALLAQAQQEQSAEILALLQSLAAGQESLAAGISDLPGAIGESLAGLLPPPAEEPPPSASPIIFSGSGGGLSITGQLVTGEEPFAHGGFFAAVSRALGVGTKPAGQATGTRPPSSRVSGFSGQVLAASPGNRLAAQFGTFVYRPAALRPSVSPIGITFRRISPVVVRRSTAARPAVAGARPAPARSYISGGLTAATVSAKGRSLALRGL